jgi:hypothetical protein
VQRDGLANVPGGRAAYAATHCACNEEYNGDGATGASPKGTIRNEFFRRIAFAEAVTAYGNNPNDPAMTTNVKGFDVSIAEICEEVADDQGSTPDHNTVALNLAPPATYAKGASC